MWGFYVAEFLLFFSIYKMAKTNKMKKGLKTFQGVILLCFSNLPFRDFIKIQINHYYSKQGVIFSMASCVSQY